jgi:dipeptidyl-peptidase-4
MGIAGGTVADWRDYDSIYTERYMLMPQNNPEGYEKSSVLKAAKNLHGQLLLIHGAIDDNVHAQNTLKFAYELQKAGKQFRLMTYETARHGVGDPDQLRHMYQMMLDFTLETLKPAPPATATTTRSR